MLTGKKLLREHSLLLIAVLIIGSCREEVKPPVLATVSTKAVTNITNTTAASGGIIEDDGGTKILSQGVCWSTSPNPTVELPTKTADNINSGEFESNLTGLTRNTSYYVRAYASNSIGVAYGDEITFTSFNATSITGSANTNNTDYFSAYELNGPYKQFKITWGRNTQYNYWFMSISNSMAPFGIWCNINIPGDGPPTSSGVYVLQPNPNTLTPGTAHVSYTVFEFERLTTTVFNSVNGELKIEVNNGQVSAIFNQIDAKTTSGAMIKLSGRFTCH